MKKRTLMNVIPTMLSVALICTGIVTPVQKVKAEGLDTKAAVIYRGNMDEKGVYGTNKDISRLGDGYSIWTWQHIGDYPRSQKGLPGSGNVVCAVLNDPNYPRSSPSGDPLTYIGTCFRNQSNWNMYSLDVSEYVQTGMVSVKVMAEKESFVPYLNIALLDIADGNNEVGINISNQYTVEDVGTWKTINIPLSDFVNGNGTLSSKNRNFNPAKLAGGGVAFSNSSEITEQGSICYGDFYIGNVLAPTGFTVSDSSDTQATFTWEPSQSNVSGYEILRDGVCVGETNADDSTFTDSGLDPMTEYSYTVRAFDDLHITSVESNPVKVFTAPTGAPKNVKAESSFGDELKVHLTWGAAAYGEAEGYNVYRDGNLIAELGADVYAYDDIENLTADNYYTYYVTSVGSGGLESMQSESVRILASHIGYPEKTEVSVNGNTARIEWNSVNGAVEYRIFRNGELVGEVDGDTYEYEQTDLEYSTAYTYCVRSVNDSGRESLNSDEKLIMAENPLITTETEIFTDSLASGYSPAIIKNSKFEISREKAAEGSASCKVIYSTGENDVDGFEITPSEATDFTKLRSNGGLIRFYVFAKDRETAEGIKVGLEALTDDFSGKKYTQRVGVDLSEYIKTYGYWSYVEIPVSAFPEMGTYRANGMSELKQKFKYNAVNGIAFYTDTAQYQTEKNIFIDKIETSSYNQPNIQSVELADGTAVAADSEISTKTDKLIVSFDMPMDSASFTAETVKLESDNGYKAVNAEYDEKTGKCILKFTAGLEKNTKYTVKFAGVKAKSGAVVQNSVFSFGTNDDEPEKGGLNSGKIAVRAVCPDSAVYNGSKAEVKLMIDDSAAAKALLCGADVTVNYSASVLAATASEVKIPAAFTAKGAAVKIENGKIKLTLPVSEDTAVSAGEELMKITFTAKNAGTAAITASGTFTEAQTQKTAELEQKTAGTVSVINKTVSGGVTGGSSGGGGGGGRSTGTGKTTFNTDVTDNTTKPQKDSGLKDAGLFDWAKAAIDYLYENGYITGYDDDTFRPENAVTREEFVTMLIKAFKADMENAECNFSDISETDWCFKYVAAAQRDKIAEGADGRFGKGDGITRQDMCAMLARAAEVYKLSLKKKYDAQLYDDSEEIAAYALQSVQKLQEAGVVNGVGDNKFDPRGTVNRAMAAKVIYEIIQINK